MIYNRLPHATYKNGVYFGLMNSRRGRRGIVGMKKYNRRHPPGRRGHPRSLIDKAKALYESDNPLKTLSEIAIECRISTKTITRYAKKEGWKRPRDAREADPGKKDLARHMLRSGEYSVFEISSITSLSESTVIKIKKEGT